MNKKIFCKTCRDEGILELITHNEDCSDCTPLTKIKAELQIQMGILDKELEESKNIEKLQEILKEIYNFNS